MWSDVDFLRKEIARIEALLVGRKANNYGEYEELQYDLASLLGELQEQESKLWMQLNRSAS